MLLRRLGPQSLAGSGYVCPRCTPRAALRQQRALHASRRVRSEQKPGVLALLEERGYINQIAGDRTTLARLLQHKPLGFYAGIDPTAPSLHLGHLLPLMVLFWLYHHGHHVVSLVGGATARVGDPSGRLTARAKTGGDVQEGHCRAMRAQVGRLWGNAEVYGRRHGFGEEGRGRREVLDNAAWLDGLGVLDFLQTMGSGMRVGAMLGRETVRNKLEKGDGMSFAEFTYPLLQAWDWWHLYRRHGVQVQIGGSDQYGNIVAGMDAVKHIASQQTSTPDRDAGQREAWLDGKGRVREECAPMGITVPLLTTAGGEKFGKSAGNAVWLDATLTSAFDLYGFLLRSPDADTERYLNLLTFVPRHQITALMAAHPADPGKRTAQHLLASEVLELVHGRDVAVRTRAEHEALRRPRLASLTSRAAAVASGMDGAGEAPGQQQGKTVLPVSLVRGTPISRILYHAGIVKTKSEGARLVAKGGVYVASLPSPSASASAATAPPVTVPADDAGSASAPTTSTTIITTLEEGDSGGLKFTQVQDPGMDVRRYVVEGVLVLRTGKWRVRVVEVVADAEFDGQGLEAVGWGEWKVAAAAATTGAAAAAAGGREEG
ncbi:tyrosyl-tRNA synthetase [Teratosphaeriaceae sp. CCFEE 6253]|nr:tyrosyl-tRNA synthetase [Teratosphaeriaceae sp. CCFEE 6253]